MSIATNERGFITLPKHRDFPGGFISFARYGADNTISIQVFAEDSHSGGERWATATVCLTPYNAPHPGEYGMWLKGWSENQGLPEALQAAGVLRITGRTHPTGYVHAQHGELTDDAIAVFKVEEEDNFGEESDDEDEDDDPGAQYTMTARQRDTVLAALRMWQSDTNVEHRAANDVATDFRSQEPLSDEEIDALCEELNS